MTQCEFYSVDGQGTRHHCVKSKGHDGVCFSPNHAGAFEYSVEKNYS